MDTERTTKQPAVALDRTETRAYCDVLWSNGRKVRVRTFGELDDRQVSTEERAERVRVKRARKIARRAKGRGLKAKLAQHGITPRGIKFVRQR